MATATTLLDEEEKNFVKFFLLNFKVSPVVIRKYFDTVFPPPSLAQTINHNKQTIINLINKKRINAAQEHILRAIPGTTWPSGNTGPSATSSKDFDLTLMICLLRNIGSIQPPSTGWDRLPSRHEKTEGAHLARLKFFRNELAHATVLKIPTSDFQDQWTIVEEALIHLNGGQCIQEADDILNHDLDSNVNLQQELETLKQNYKIFETRMTSAIASEQQLRSEFEHYKSGNLPKNIADNIDKMTNTWEKEDGLYFETGRCKRFLRTLGQVNHITVTGNSGDGKSSLARHAALKLKRDCHFEIVPVETPEQILQYKTNLNQVFVIDDVVGKYCVDINLLKIWERLNEKLKECVNGDDGVKIICTLRKQVAMTKQFKSSESILRVHLFNLDDPLNLLSESEKRQIYLSHYNSGIGTSHESGDTKDIGDICKNNFAFPLLCQLVTNNEERFKNRHQLFKAPYQLFKSELDKLCNYCPEEYLILVVCMLFGGKIKLSEFISCTNEDLMKLVSQSCGVERNFTERVLLDGIENLKGSFVTIAEHECRFLHDKLFESVSCHFTSRDSRLMFSVCPFNFITERVRVESDLSLGDENTKLDDENTKLDDENTKLDDESTYNSAQSGNNTTLLSDDSSIVVDNASFEILGKRVLCELQHGRFLNVLVSKLMTNTEFIDFFGTLITESSCLCSFELLTTESVQSANIMSVLKEYLSKKPTGSHTINKTAVDHVIRATKSRSRLIHWLVAFGHDLLFHCLWKSLKKSQIQTFIGRDRLFLLAKPILPLAILGGNYSIIKTLIEDGGDVCSISEDGNSTLMEAVQTGSTEIVSMLIKNGVSVNEGHIFKQKTPVQECVRTGNIEVMKLLFENNAQLNKKLINRLTSFYKLYNDNTISSDMMSELVRNDGGNNDIHDAVLNKDQSKVEYLMKNGDSKIITQNNNGQTALHLAALFGDTETMSVLLEESTTCSYINSGDLNGVRPLHLAVIRNDYDSVDLLLRHGANKCCRDTLGKTPGHFVQCTQVAKMLFTQNQESLMSKAERLPYVGRQQKDGESNFDEIPRDEGGNINETLKFGGIKILRTVFLNVIFACIPRDFTFHNRLMFGTVANVRDNDGNTPMHAVAKFNSSSHCDTSCQIINILLQCDGDIYLRNIEGDMPLDLLTDQMRGKIQAKKPKPMYFQVEKIVFTVLTLLMFTLSCLFCYLSYTVHLDRYLSVPNQHQKCHVFENEKYNTSASDIYSLTIFQESLSKPFDVIIPIFLFCLAYLCLYRRLYIVTCIGALFTTYFGVMQVLKVFSFTIFILSIVYISSYAADNDFLPFMQYLFIYLFFIDFKTLLVLQNETTGCFWKYLVLLTTALLYIVLFIISLTQVDLIELDSVTWETAVNCSRHVYRQNVSTRYHCQADNDHKVFFIDIFSKRDEHVYVFPKNNNSDFAHCSGTETANEIAYHNILFNLYSSLLGFVSVMFYFYGFKRILYLLSVSFFRQTYNHMTNSNYKFVWNIVMKFDTVFIILLDCFYLYFQYTFIMYLINFTTK